MGGSIARWTTIENRADLLAARVKASDFDYHLHDTYTIGAMRSGTANFYIRNKKHQAVPGDVFIIHPYDVHNVECSDETIEYDVLYPSVALMADVMGVDAARGDIPRIGPTVLNFGERTSDFLSTIENFIDLAPEARSSLKIECAFTKMFRARTSVEALEVLPRQQIEAVKIACDRIQSDPAGVIDLHMLAEEVGFSRFHFTRIFRRATGMSPNVFLRQVRLAFARNLIRQGYPLADVAARAGFSDQAHLTREFKRVYGLTPGQLVRSVKLGISNPKQGPVNAASIH